MENFFLENQDNFEIPKNLKKTLKIYVCFNTFCKIGLSKLTSIFDSILVPTCFDFPSKNQSKLDQNWNLEGIDFLIDVCIDFLSIFLRFGTPTWSYVGPLDSSKTPPRRLQDGSQDEVRDIFRFWLNFGRFGIDVWSILARCLVDFGSFFGWFSIDFWSGFWSAFC